MNWNTTHPMTTADTANNMATKHEVQWELPSPDAMRLSAGTSHDWEHDPAVREEVRADARVLPARHRATRCAGSAPGVALETVEPTPVRVAVMPAAKPAAPKLDVLDVLARLAGRYADALRRAGEEPTRDLAWTEAMRVLSGGK